MLTACGIETVDNKFVQLMEVLAVATVLTACGIETTLWYLLPLCGRRRLVATVLTACGIETPPKSSRNIGRTPLVATVLTACGIETN